jgi:hypothetical protein
VGAALVCAAALVWASLAGDDGQRTSTASPTGPAAGAALVAAAPPSSRAPAVDAAGPAGRPGTPRSALPEAQACAAYDVGLLAVGGVGPLRWSVAAGRLPAGLRLDAGGRLHGVPRRPGTARLVVVAAGSSGRAARERITLVTRPARGAPEALASLGPWPPC